MPAFIQTLKWNLRVWNGNHMRRRWIKIQMDSEKRCIPTPFLAWPFCTLLCHYQRFLSSHFPRGYSQNITALFNGVAVFAHVFLLPGCPQLHLHYAKRQQDKIKGCSDTMVDFWKFSRLHDENSVRGHLSELQTRTIPNGNAIRKIARSRPSPSRFRKMDRCGHFRRNCFGVIDKIKSYICHLRSWCRIIPGWY